MKSAVKLFCKIADASADVIAAVTPVVAGRTAGVVNAFADVIVDIRKAIESDEGVKRSMAYGQQVIGRATLEAAQYLPSAQRALKRLEAESKALGTLIRKMEAEATDQAKNVAA